MTTSDAGLVGTLRMDAEHVILRLAGSYGTDAADLWSALTDPDRVARWLARVEGDCRLGGTFRAYLFDTEETVTGTVLICDPPRHLQVSWAADDGEPTLVEIELTEEGERTRLLMHERGIPRSFAAEYGAGWQTHFDGLAAHLGGKARPEWRARWVELMPAFRAQAAGLR